MHTVDFFFLSIFKETLSFSFGGPFYKEFLYRIPFAINTLFYPSQNVQ